MGELGRGGQGRAHRRVLRDRRNALQEHLRHLSRGLGGGSHHGSARTFARRDSGTRQLRDRQCHLRERGPQPRHRPDRRPQHSRDHEVRHRRHPLQRHSPGCPPVRLQPQPAQGVLSRLVEAEQERQLLHARNGRLGRVRGFHLCRPQRPRLRHDQAVRHNGSARRHDGRHL